MGGRADPVGAHPPRAAGPARDRQRLAVQLPRRPGRREFIGALLAQLPELERNGEVFASAGDALAREPLAELLPRFFPATEEAAYALTGASPAFSAAKAERLLGWTAKRSWRTELA